MKIEFAKNQPIDPGDYHVEYFSGWTGMILWSGQSTLLWDLNVKYWYEN